MKLDKSSTITAKAKEFPAKRYTKGNVTYPPGTTVIMAGLGRRGRSRAFRIDESTKETLKKFESLQLPEFRATAEKVTDTVRLIMRFIDRRKARASRLVGQLKSVNKVQKNFPKRFQAKQFLHSKGKHISALVDYEVLQAPKGYALVGKRGVAVSASNLFLSWNTVRASGNSEYAAREPFHVSVPQDTQEEFSNPVMDTLLLYLDAQAEAGLLGEGEEMSEDEVLAFLGECEPRAV